MPEWSGQPPDDDLDAFVARRAEHNPELQEMVDAILNTRQRTGATSRTSAERYFADRLIDPGYRRHYCRALRRLRRRETALSTYVVRLSRGWQAYLRLPRRLHPRDVERLKAFLRAVALGDRNQAAADEEADG